MKAKKQVSSQGPRPVVADSSYKATTAQTSAAASYNNPSPHAAQNTAGTDVVGGDVRVQVPTTQRAQLPAQRVQLKTPAPGLPSYASTDRGDPLFPVQRDVTNHRGPPQTSAPVPMSAPIHPASLKRQHSIIGACQTVGGDVLPQAKKSRQGSIKLTNRVSEEPTTLQYRKLRQPLVRSPGSNTIQSTTPQVVHVAQSHTAANLPFSPTEPSASRLVKPMEVIDLSIDDDVLQGERGPDVEESSSKPIQPKKYSWLSIKSFEEMARADSARKIAKAKKEKKSKGGKTTKRAKKALPVVDLPGSVAGVQDSRQTVEADPDFLAEAMNTPDQPTGTLVNSSSSSSSYLAADKSPETMPGLVIACEGPNFSCDSSYTYAPEQPQSVPSTTDVTHGGSSQSANGDSEKSHAEDGISFDIDFSELFGEVNEGEADETFAGDDRNTPSDNSAAQSSTPPLIYTNASTPETLDSCPMTPVETSWN